jgi:uncharacterized membrane protein
MQHGNAPDRDPPIFSAVLTPYRSLGGRGFVVVMAAVAAISFVAGLAFLAIGAWPVTGFFGFDALAIYVAFRINYRDARAYEEVSVTSSELTVRKVDHRGRAALWSANPAWTRLEREVDDDYGVQKLFLVTRGHRFAVGSFLAPDEKASFATALSSAIGKAKRGPARTAI